MRDRNDLAQKIDEILSINNNVTTLEEAAQMRKRLAQSLAQSIDEYIQVQIGIRLEQILTSLQIDARNPRTPVLVEGSTFNSLIRKQ